MSTAITVYHTTGTGTSEATYKTTGEHITNATFGTSAGDLIQLDGSGKLPAVDGSQLTNLSSGSVATDAIWSAKGDLVVGTGSHAAGIVSIGTAGQVLTVSGGTATWQNSSATATGAPKMVAASNATAYEKAWATATGGTICDGTHDETDINTALSASAYVQLSSGTFGIQGAITINTGNRLLGCGIYTTILNMTAGHFDIFDKDYVEIGQFKVTGTDYSSSTFPDAGPHRATFGIYASATHGYHWYHDLWITTIGSVSGNGGQQSHFNLYPNNATLQYLTFDRVICDSPDGFGFLHGGNIAAGSGDICDHITYRDCKVYNAGVAATRTLWSSVGWQTCWDFEDVGLSTCSHLRLINCHGNGAWESIYHMESSTVITDAVLVGCDATRGGQNPSFVYGAGFFTTAQTTLDHCNATYNAGPGVDNVTGNGARIFGGHYNYNSGDGIDITESSNNVISGAEVMHNAGHGVDITGYGGINADDNIVADCHINNNTKYGVIIGGTTLTNRTKIHDIVSVSNGFGNYYDGGTSTAQHDNYMP